MTAIQRSKISDEVFVWFTSLGLVIGLSMVVFLLGLVLKNGMEVFWPKKIVEIRLKEGSGAGISGSVVFGGEISKVQQKLSRASQDEAHEEIQIYVGNKDAYGFAFKYVDRDQIDSILYPPDILLVERMEYGDAIGFPAALETASDGIVPYSDGRFGSRLKRAVREAGARRDEIRKIEKEKIGKINREMEAIRLKERAAAQTGDPLNASLSEKKAKLSSQYEVLAAQARALRARQKEDVLVYRLMSGQERRLPAGQIVDYYFANQLTVWGRTQIFVHSFWLFLTQEPREANTEGGIFPAIFGTFVMTLLMSVAVMPFGVLAAIYLREYAKQGFLARAVRIAVNNLAGVPSIVFGVFGLGFFVYFVGAGIDSVFFKEALPTPTFGTGGILWASLTLALMTVPVVIVATEEALAAVPRGVREGSLACGASKWQTIQHVVLPASAPGIMTGLILAMARGAGEVAPLMLVGVVKLAPTLPIDGIFPFVHFDRKFMHLGFHIYDLGFQSPDSEAAKPMVFATTLLLIGLVVVLNMGAILIREKLRKKYMVGAF